MVKEEKEEIWGKLLNEEVLDSIERTARYNLEYIISGNSADIKINEVQRTSGVTKGLATYYESYVLVSVSNGGRYKPVLYFTKIPHMEEEAMELSKPDLKSVPDCKIPEFFSKALDDYYTSKNVKYKFNISYLNKGDWIIDLIKFAKIKKERYKELEDMYNRWQEKGEI